MYLCGCEGCAGEVTASWALLWGSTLKHVVQSVGDGVHCLVHVIGHPHLGHLCITGVGIPHVFQTSARPHVSQRGQALLPSERQLASKQLLPQHVGEL